MGPTISGSGQLCIAGPGCEERPGRPPWPGRFFFARSGRCAAFSFRPRAGGEAQMRLVFRVGEYQTMRILLASAAAASFAFAATPAFAQYGGSPTDQVEGAPADVSTAPSPDDQ